MVTFIPTGATCKIPDTARLTEVRLIQTDLWRTSDGGHLIWSGTLRTLDAVNSNAVDKAVSKNIMPELERQGLVPGKNK